MAVLFTYLYVICYFFYLIFLLLFFMRLINNVVYHFVRLVCLRDCLSVKNLNPAEKQNSAVNYLDN